MKGTKKEKKNPPELDFRFMFSRRYIIPCNQRALRVKFGTHKEGKAIKKGNKVFKSLFCTMCGSDLMCSLRLNIFSLYPLSSPGT